MAALLPHDPERLPRADAPRDHGADSGGLGQREWRHELLTVAEHGETWPCPDQAAQRLPPGRGDADSRDGEPSQCRDTEPGPPWITAAAGDVTGTAHQGQDHPEHSRAAAIPRGHGL